MSGAQRCDEIIRAIDEVLGSFGQAPVGEDNPAKIARLVEADREPLPLAGLVRWGAVPRPLTAGAF